MHLFSHLARKSAQKKPPHKPIGLCRGENKKKIYYMRVLFEGGCSLLHLKTAECFCTSLHSFTIIIEIVHERRFEAPMP